MTVEKWADRYREGNLKNEIIRIITKQEIITLILLVITFIVSSHLSKYFLNYK